jgi:hypothetical protein
VEQSHPYVVGGAAAHANHVGLTITGKYMIFEGLYLIVFNHRGYETLAGAGSSEYAKPFRKHLFQSLLGSGLAITLAVVIATATGHILLSGPVACNKALTTSGGFFAAWGTWFGITERRESHKKCRLDERLRDVVFVALFVPGVVFGALGGLW